MAHDTEVGHGDLYPDLLIVHILFHPFIDDRTDANEDTSRFLLKKKRAIVPGKILADGQTVYISILQTREMYGPSYTVLCRPIRGSVGQIDVTLFLSSGVSPPSLAITAA